MTALITEPPQRLAALQALAASELTGIGWTDVTQNYWFGCTKVSAGCRLCYAETLATRYGHTVWGNTADRRILSDANARKPLRYQRIAARHDTFFRMFCGSMMDWAEIHPNPDVNARLNTARAVMFDICERTDRVRWQLTTKRPENVTRLVPAHWLTGGWPPNVWLGTSVENQAAAAQRIPVLTSVPGPPVRFLSAEPLIGPVDLRPWLAPDAVNWLIIGGESGSTSPKTKPSRRARPMDLRWADAAVTAGRAAGIAVFVKQLGSAAARDLGLQHRKGEDPAEWPTTLQVQHFPDVTR